MIDFRYHVVTVVAIFFALAAGIALGAGPLQAQLSQSLTDQASSDRLGEQRAQTDLNVAQARLAFADDFAGSTSPAIVGSALEGRTVSIIMLPGADRSAVRALREEIVAAEGSVVSSLTFTRDLLDPANRQLAEGLSERVLSSGGSKAAGSTKDRATGSYQLVGAAVARAFLTTSDQRAERDDTAIGIEAAFTEAGLISAGRSPARRAQLALLVTGAPTADDPDGYDAVAAEIAVALDESAVGVVVAGPSAAADKGVVRAVRESTADAKVSSVDALDLPAGRVVTVLALAEQAQGAAGQYGVGEAADSAAPRIRR